MPTHKSAGRFTSNRVRTINTLPRLTRILIVCEGEKTEPNYFKALKDTHKLSNVIVEVDGAARVGQSLVEYAIKKAETASEPYTEVWCVFDEDSLKASFDNAVAMINARPYLRAAWSNEAFELWYILHFEYLDAAITRSAYKKRLHTLVRPLELTMYEKNNRQMYEKLGTQRLKVACSNARKLLAVYDEATPCHKRKPATMVFALVERLLSYAPDNPLGN